MSEGEAPSGSRIRLLSQLVLHVAGVTRSDRGMYQCFVRNDKESAQGSAELRLGGEFCRFGPVLTPVERLSKSRCLSFYTHVTTGKSLIRFAWNFCRSLLINKITVKSMTYPLKEKLYAAGQKGSLKGKLHLTTSNEGPEGYQRCGCTLYWTSALDGNGYSMPRPGHFCPRKRPGSHYTKRSSNRLYINIEEEAKYEINIFVSFYSLHLHICTITLLGGEGRGGET